MIRLLLLAACASPPDAELFATAIDPEASLDEAPAMYEKFQKKQDGCIKVVLKP